MKREKREFHEMRGAFHPMKPSWHNYQVCSLGNCAMKQCTKTGLTEKFNKACYLWNAPVCYLWNDYEPGSAFEEVEEEAVLDISPTDSTEFWLIQWPKDQLDASDFHGKKLSLKLHNDGNLGSFESSSGKSYQLVSFAAQQPDATVFQPSGSEIKPVGKISRRVCLVRYPEPEELAKPNFGSLTPSSKKSAGSSRKTMSRFTSASKNRSSQGSARSLGQWSTEPTPKHKHKRKEESSLGHSNMSGKASEGSQAHGAEGNTISEKPQSSSEKSKKKKKVKIVE